jgi:hypothetical protein
VLKSLHRLALLTGLLVCLSAVAAGAALAGSASAALSLPVTKVTEPVSTVLPARVSLPTSLPSLPGAAKVLGAAATTTPARALISLRHRNAAQLQSFIAKVSDPSSPSYEHYLTPAQFDATYAPSTSTAQAVEAFAQHSGLRVHAVPSNRAYVYVTGSVAQMQRAFATSIKTYLLNGEKVQSPTTAPSVPTSIASAVTAVEGLDTADVAPAVRSADPAHSRLCQRPAIVELLGPEPGDAGTRRQRPEPPAERRAGLHAAAAPGRLRKGRRDQARTQRLRSDGGGDRRLLLAHPHHRRRHMVGRSRPDQAQARDRRQRRRTRPA